MIFHILFIFPLKHLLKCSAKKHMFTFNSGILDKTKLFSNFLLILLVAGNIFFSIQYIANIQAQNAAQSDNTPTRIQASKLLKLFVDVVLNTEGKTISYADRVSLENDVIQMNDADITSKWATFVASTDAKSAQSNAVILMKLLTNKLLLN